MKCNECEALIEEYIAGELDHQANAQVAAHVMGCAACSDLCEEVRRELEIYARYERDVEVTPALWSAIATRIKQEKVVDKPGALARLKERIAAMFSTPRLSLGFATAMMLAAIGITLALTTYLNSRNGNGNSNTIATSGGNGEAVQSPANANDQNGTSQQPTPTERAGGQAPSVGQEEEGSGTPDGRKETTPVPQRQAIAKAQPASAEQLVREAEQKYLAAIAILQRDVSRRRTQTDPAVLARFDVALAEIDRTITDTRRVVRQNPDDPAALQYLLAAYSKKVDVLREMSRGPVAEDQ